MILFFIAVGLLLTGYFIYSKFIEKIWGINENRITPAVRYADGVDFVKMPLWRIFLIQFLNIAGLGPVFGAILGAVYGPIALLWIVFGCIFAGGVHDYLTGMISLKFKGKSIVYVTEKLFGKNFKTLFLIFYLILLLLLGTVFAVNPAKMIADLSHTSLNFWIVVVFTYYFLTTLMPIDKIMGKIYPYFAILLLVMTVSVMIMLFKSGLPFYPQLTFSNLHPEHIGIFPMLFITIACGAISGFHATQSPIMARCLPNEKDGRIIFYGTMVTEGIIALIWATLSMAFFHNSNELYTIIHTSGQGEVVSLISTGLLGNTGGALTILSIVALSITSGGSAFRSIRLTVTDFLNIKKQTNFKRLLLSLFILSCGVILSRLNYTTLWQYFGWANQALSALVLWTLTYYLKKKSKNYYITLIPALFMTSVIVSYIFQDKIGFNIQPLYANIVGILIAIIFCIIFFASKKRVK